MSIRINGNKVEGRLVLKGKMYQLTTDFKTFPLALQRADSCEVEIDSELLHCTVAESRVVNRYGKDKQRVLLLRVDSRKEKAVEKKPIQKIVEPAITKKTLDSVNKGLKQAKEGKLKKNAVDLDKPKKKGK